MGAGDRLIVCLTGMPGAGKSTIAGGLRERGGHTLVNMGDAVRAEAARRGLEPTSDFPSQPVQRAAFCLSRCRRRAQPAPGGGVAHRRLRPRVAGLPSRVLM